MHTQAYYIHTNTLAWRRLANYHPPPSQSGGGSEIFVPCVNGPVMWSSEHEQAPSRVPKSRRAATSPRCRRPDINVRAKPELHVYRVLLGLQMEGILLQETTVRE